MSDELEKARLEMQLAFTRYIKLLGDKNPYEQAFNEGRNRCNTLRSITQAKPLNANEKRRTAKHIVSSFMYPMVKPETIVEKTDADEGNNEPTEQ